AGVISLIAPDLLLAEFGSLLAKRHRCRQLSAEQARQAFHLIAASALMLTETRPLLFRALNLSLRHEMSLWDCVYIALATERNCPFLTADVRLFRAGGARHPDIRLIQ